MFRFPVRVYYSDTDAGGIVYHARYLDFAEHARTEMFRTISEMVVGAQGSQRALMETTGLAFIISSATIDYKKPGFLDDILEIQTSVEDMKRFSMVFHQRVMRGEDVLAELRIKVAAMDMAAKRPAPIPEWLSCALQGGKDEPV
ncbi:YbgC/FadM family acyl-CoA thioesterase [Parasphaerochaeta coccoides]|uniref:4-hydroxybenzoyl-CoA thioesterase n=1 Tax=Parasphaerochaeta coccoides (strain ATCC BAA-1237 / DSM 17374 / SPN1) TaxID=760011 RepID=F4GHA2_PARC1|nr:YbgC/FadM family acyl-CoA thioesterase [Parasphaerochaeta coccoides]AEC02001.1 4-hydroxybenzoyl-CoA thioesterase [Parasphaerochaeta coccoides DSM 17374]